MLPSGFCTNTDPYWLGLHTLLDPCVLQNPKKMLKPSLAMALLLETLLTFLKAHLPLTAEQRSVIDPRGPRSKAAQAPPLTPPTAVATPGSKVRDTAVQGATSAMAPPTASGDATAAGMSGTCHG